MLKNVFYFSQVCSVCCFWSFKLTSHITLNLFVPLLASTPSLQAIESSLLKYYLVVGRQLVKILYLDDKSLLGIMNKYILSYLSSFLKTGLTFRYFSA